MLRLNKLMLRLALLGVLPLAWLAWIDWRIAVCVFLMMWANNLMMKYG